MSEKKATGLRDYEVMLVLEPGVQEGQVTETLKALGQIVGDKGEVGSVQRWGKRALAYEIASFSEGYYVVVRLRLEPTSVEAFERSLRLTDGVIRFKVIRLPEAVAVANVDHNGAASQGARSSGSVLVGSQEVSNAEQTEAED